MRYLLATFVIITMVLGQWSSDPGNPIPIGTGIAPEVVVSPDGDTYIAWLTDGNYHVYLQHLDPTGAVMWGDGGILISDNPNSSWIAVFHLNLKIDHDGNAIITTVDTRTGDWEVFAWKIAPDGSMLWNTNGLQLSSSGTGNTAPRMTVLYDNSIVATWSQGFSDVKMQRISPDGVFLWGDNGIQISDPAGSLVNPLPIVTSDDQILVQWIKQTGSWPVSSELINQKFDLDGGAIWPVPLQIVGPLSFPMGNWSQQTVADNNGGGFSSWTEMTSNAQTGKVQHVTSTGQNLWPVNAELSTAFGHFRTNPQIAVAEDSQELMAVWTESDASQQNRGIFAQRINGNGGRMWGEIGFPAIPLGSESTYLGLAASGFEEDIIAFFVQQISYTSNDIFAFRLDSNSDFVWIDQVVQLTISGTSKSDLTIEKGPGCNVAVWSEAGSITAHCVRVDGTLGAPIIINECLPDGDVNDDGDLNILDIVQILNYILGIVEPTEEQVCSADMNQDGSIDILDIVQILNMIL